MTSEKRLYLFELRDEIEGVCLIVAHYTANKAVMDFSEDLIGEGYWFFKSHPDFKVRKIKSSNFVMPEGVTEPCIIDDEYCLRAGFYDFVDNCGTVKCDECGNTTDRIYCENKKLLCTKCF